VTDADRDRPAGSPDAQHAIERIYREEYGRVVASLVRRFGSIDVAEDAAGEALLAALEKWPVDGVPPNPGGWLTTTAGNRAIDKLRRESHRDAKHQAALMIQDDTPHEPTGLLEDDRLRLIFTCCHPALAPESRVALTLRLLGGLTVAEIAQAFLVPETTMAQRITRAKKKISAAKIPYRVPEAADLAPRLSTVLAVVYLVFNEGYLTSSADAPPVREELTGEAIRLGRILRQLLPDVPEVAGLLALMLLIESRRASRVAGGELVPLDQQDRGGWDRELIAEGHALVRECLALGRPGPYQVQAAINAVHTDAPTAADTDWAQIARLYDQLRVLAPSPFVELNRAVAIAELDGPEVALALVDAVELPTYHAWHATRADLLRRLGRSAEARQAYDAAIAATDNAAEIAYLSRRRDQLSG
jgi:RNA polymerase sigma-70 factor (ECF subfamily)